MKAPAYPQLERLLEDIPAFATDISELLPMGWQNDIFVASETSSAWQTLEGGSVTSREEFFGSAAEAHVGVVTGDIVAETVPWLDGLYRTEILARINSLGLGQYEVSADLRSGINLNTTLKGARYEWHVDSNPMTALLFITTHEPADGGQLLFRPDPEARPGESWELQVSPKSGTLLLFDAREAAHVVTEVLTGRRISAPMNYYDAGKQERPADLDGYLYG
jgi:hypothetical protein